MADNLGIDISQWQGTIDFSKVKDVVDFVIIRAGYGFIYDSKAKEYAEECKKYNIPIGLYWFSYALSEDEAKKEAQKCLTFAYDYDIQYPIYFDFEDESAKHYKSILKKECGSKEICVFTDAFCKEIEDNNYFAGIYCNYNFYKNIYTSLYCDRYALWLATRNTSKPVNCGMWQYTDQGNVAGIYSKVDMDICFNDYPGIIKAAKLNTNNKVIFKKIYDLIDELKRVVEKGEKYGFG